MPSILLLSANDPDSRLNQLSNEIKEIQRTLNKAFGKDYDVDLAPDATIKDLIEELNIPNREIEVMHYAGHASSSLIHLVDGNAEASDLSEKLHRLGTVKLVFLNGCATSEQVTYFHDAGVPFVIATQCQVEDESARQTANQLYLYLGLGRSLREACEEVETDMRKLLKKVDFVAARGLGDYSTSSFPWGLYIKPGAEAEDYRLPFSFPSSPPTLTINHTSFLNKLILTLAKLDSPAMESIRNLGPTLSRGTIPDGSKINELLKVLPLTLSIRLRQITAEVEHQSDEYFRELLYDYAFFFDTLLQHHAAFLLAQNWGAKKRLSPQVAALLKRYLQADLLRTSADLYPNLLKALVEDNTIATNSSFEILPTESLIYLASPDFQTAADFFLGLKQYYWQRIRLLKAEALHNCFQAQEYLAEAFNRLRFSLGFVMASVRGINVINLRYVDREFDNIVSKLLAPESQPLPYSGPEMMENRSVLCFAHPKISATTPSLNLFPFLIDRNVFTGKPNTAVDIYLYAGYYSPQGTSWPCFHFVSVSNPGKVWCFDENREEVSLLHIGEPANMTHEANHLMTNTWEFKHYLTQFKHQFLNS